MTRKPESRQSPWWRDREYLPPLSDQFFEDLFQAERLLPSQLLPSSKPSTPERRLLAAVLIEAIAIYVGEKFGAVTHGSLEMQRRRVVAEAAYWIERHNTGVFGFDWVCQHLDFDPSSLRAQLSRLRAAGARPRVAAVDLGGFEDELKEAVG